jgi:hypothetical protein
MSRLLKQVAKGETHRYSKPKPDPKQAYALGAQALANIDSGADPEFRKKLLAPKPKVRNVMEEDVEEEARQRRREEIKRDVTLKSEVKGQGIPLCGCGLYGKHGGAKPHTGFEIKPTKTPGQEASYTFANKDGKILDSVLPTPSALMDPESNLEQPKKAPKPRMRSIQLLPGRNVELGNPARRTHALLNETKRGIGATRFPTQSQKTFQALGTRRGIIGYDVGRNI